MDAGDGPWAPDAARTRRAYVVPWSSTTAKSGGGRVSGGGAQQFTCLPPKLVEIGTVGKPGHGVSWLPGFALGHDEKTILPKA
jgi:hypothetical protein